MALTRQVILQFGAPGSSGKEHRDLRVAFRIRHSRDRTMNSAAITAYNLTTQSVSALDTAGAIVRLFAGYDVPRLLFEGNPQNIGVRSQKQGPDRITTIECADGLIALGTKRIAISSATQMSIGEVLAEVETQLGLPLGAITIGNADGRYPLGTTVSGRPAYVLDQLASSLGADWWVQDGRLYFVLRASPISGTALLASSAQGTLIGSPTKTKEGVEITTLLDPSMRPGRLVRLEADTMSGDFVAQVVEMIGDSWGGPWYSKITAKPLGKA
jgi:hypothetical protein